MVGRYRQAKSDPVTAANCLLALHGITEPTVDQRVGALLEAEFRLRVISFLSPKKG